MEMNDVMSLVSSVGFPIFACIYLFRLYDKFSATLQMISETMKAMEIRLSKIEYTIEDKERRDDDDGR